MPGMTAIRRRTVVEVPGAHVGKAPNVVAGGHRVAKEGTSTKVAPSFQTGAAAVDAVGAAMAGTLPETATGKVKRSVPCVPVPHAKSGVVLGLAAVRLLVVALPPAVQ